MISALVLHIDLNVQSLGLNNNILKLKLIGKKKTNTKCYLAALLCTPNYC